MNKKPDVITTPRLRLGPVRDEQEDAVIDLLAKEEVGRTYMLPEFTCREQIYRVFDTYRQRSRAEDRFVYGIYRDEVLVGLLNDVCIENGGIELGYIIHPDHKNQGYATEALAGATKALFDMGFSRVRTGAFPENIPSIRVMEKCGMVRLEETETLEYRGKTYHCVLFEKYPE